MIRKFFASSYIIPVCLFVLIIAIAWCAEWQYDEAWSYWNVLGLSAADIAEYTKFKIANNHVFNSLYYHVLQLSHVRFVFVYRLWSVASFILYAVYIYKLLKLDGIDSKRWLAWLVMYLMPYILFFTLARGYAFSIACFVAAFYYFRLFNNAEKSKHLLLLVLFACFSAVSLFSFVIPFIAMMMLVVIRHFKTLFKRPVLIAIMALALPALLYVFLKASIVTVADPFIVGSDALIKNGMFSSVVTYMCLFDFVPSGIFMIFKWTFLISIIPVLVVLIKRKDINEELLIVLFSFTILIIAHYALGSKYPLYRSISYIIILFYLALLRTNKNLFITAHLVVISLIGAYNTVLMIQNGFRHDVYDALKYVATRDRTLVIADNLNPNAKLYNLLYFNDSLSIFQYENIEVDSLFYNHVPYANHIICPKDKLDVPGIKGDFTLKYNFPYNAFFVRKAGTGRVLRHFGH